MGDEKRHQRVKQLFLAATELEPGSRQAYLDRECAGDLELLYEVMMFLEMDAEEREDLVDKPAVERIGWLGSGNSNGKGSAESTTAERNQIRSAAAHRNGSDGPHRQQSGPRPDKIGPYRIIDTIAESSTTSIYLAEKLEPDQDQVPDHGQVVVKVFKNLSHEPLLRNRFEVERQILTRLDHPNIALVYEVGDDGQNRPFLVLEPVSGEPITDYCNRQQLSVDERLRLFAVICRAVSHLHQKCLLHRDIRPTNVLVTTAREGSGSPPRENAPQGNSSLREKCIPKLVNIAITKDLEAPPANALNLIQARGIGTPTFTAPEILRAHSSGDLDIRTDVYSLGMLLNELLIDKTPLVRFTRASVRRDPQSPPEEPQEPSICFAALDRATATLRARPRGLTPPALVRRLHGDLDRIILTAVATDIEQRYASAAELAADVERHRAGLPADAGSPVRRREGLRALGRRTITLALILLALVAAGLAERTVASRQAARRVALSAQEAEAAHRVGELLAGLLGDQLAGDSWEAGCDILTDTAQPYLSTLAGQPAAQARLLLTAGRACLELGCYQQAEPLLREAVNIRKQLFADEHHLVTEAEVVLDELKRLRTIASATRLAEDRAAP